MSNVIKLKRGSGNDPSASDLVVGELAIRTDTGKIFLKKDNGNIAEVSGGGGVSDGDKGDITVSNSGDTFTIDSGVIVASKIASDAITTSKIANLQVTDVKLADNSVALSKIVDGVITNAKINANAAIAGTKISPNFGSQAITSTGAVNAGLITVSGSTPAVNFTDNEDNPDYRLVNTNGVFKIRDTTNVVDRLKVHTDGHIDITGNLDVGAGIDVTGGITYSTTSIASGTLEFANTLASYDPSVGTSGSDTSTNTAISLGFGQQIAVNSDGYIRNILKINSSADRNIEIGHSSTNYIGDILLLPGVNHAVRLRYNGSDRLVTNSTGVDITGGIEQTGTSYIQAGAFSNNVSVGGRSLTANIDILSTSLRGGVVVRNANDYRTDTIDSAGFQVLDPYDSSNTSYAFRAAEGATLADNFWVKTNGTAYFAGNISCGGTVDGRDVASDGTKLDTYEANGSSYLRSDANDTMTGILSLESNSQYPLVIDGDHNGKVVLKGSTDPYIRFQEGTTNKAYIQWNSAGYLEINNQETNEGLRIKTGNNGLVFTENGAEYKVFHAGNDGAGSGLDADNLDSLGAHQFLRSDAADSFSGNLTGSSGTNIKLDSNIGSAGSTAYASMAGYLEFTNDYSDSARGANKIRLQNDGNWLAGFGISANSHDIYTGGNFNFYKSNSTTSFTFLMGLSSSGNLSIAGTVDGVDIATRDTLFGGLTSSSGVLTNGVTATTQSAGDNSTKVATTAYTDTAISNLVDSSPSTLNTLNELAAALGDDANFSTTVTNSIATKFAKAGGTLTGNVTIDKSGVANITVKSSNDYGTIEVGGSTGAFIDLKSPATDDYDTRFTHDGFIYAKNNITLSPTSGNVVNVARNLNAQEGLDVTGALAVTGNISNSAGQITCGVHGTSGIQIINDGTFGTLHSVDLVLRTASTERARLDTNGNFELNNANAAFKSISSSSGDYIRLYAGAGTGKWDIYGHGANLRFSDNESAGSIVFDQNVDANGGLDVTGGITASSTGNASLILDAGTGSQAGNQVSFIDFKLDGTVKANIAVNEATSGNPLEINSAGTGATKLFNAGSEKLSTSSSGISVTGNIIASGNITANNGTVTVSGSAPKITFTETNDNPDYKLEANGGNLAIIDTTNSATRFSVSSSGASVTGTCTATTFSGSGASLTNIPAGQLTGTIADARLPNTITPSTLVSTVEVRTSNGQQLVLNAGESNGKVSGQTGEYVYVNAEAGLSVNTPDSANANWQGGTASDQTLITGTAITIDGNTVFHQGNDGSGSGLDADTLDGQQGSYYADAASYVKEIRTDDDITARMDSGFYETSTATTGEGWPETSNSWYHLIASTHSNTTNYYSMQIAGNFFAQKFYIRNTHASGTRAWSEIWTSSTDGSGSGLDADTLDGVQGINYVRTDQNTTITSDLYIGGGAGGITVNGGSDIRFTNGDWTGNFGGKIQHHSNTLYLQGGSGTYGIMFRDHAGTNRWSVLDSGNLYPMADSSYDIGSNTQRVANGYFDTLYGAGSNITALNASNISSGTISDARLPSSISSDITGNAATATTSTRVTVTDNSSDTSCFVLFTQAATGNQLPHSGSNLTFNASSGLLTATSFSGNGASLTNVNATTLDSIDSGSFLRSDANDTFTGTLTAGQNGKIAFPDNTTIPDNPTNEQHDYITFGGNGSISQISGRVGLMISSSDDSLVLANGDVGRDFTSSNINVDPENVYILSDGNFYVKTDLQEGWGTEHTLGFTNTGVLTVNDNTVFHAGNDGSGSGLDADTLDGVQGSSYLRSDAADTGTTLTLTDALRTDRFEDQGGAFFWREGLNTGRHRHLNLADTTSDPASVTDSHNPTGISWGQRSDNNAYYMLGLKGSYNNGYSTHSRLTLGWHTGIELGASATYGGVRFFGDTPFLNTTEIMQINSSGGHVKVKNNLYANNGGLVWNANNDGSGSGLDADTLDGSQANAFIRSGAQSSVSGWHINAYRNGTGTSPRLYFSHSDGYGQHINTYNTSSGVYALQLHNNSKELFAVYNDGTAYHRGHVLPGDNNTWNLGSSGNRWNNIYVNDMHFSNEGKTNDVDGSWGDWTLQEGESDIFMINNRSGKKFKIAMIPV